MDLVLSESLREGGEAGSVISEVGEVAGQIGKGVGWVRLPGVLLESGSSSEESSHTCG